MLQQIPFVSKSETQSRVKVALLLNSRPQLKRLTILLFIIWSWFILSPLLFAQNISIIYAAESTTIKVIAPLSEASTISHTQRYPRTRLQTIEKIANAKLGRTVRLTSLESLGAIASPDTKTDSNSSLTYTISPAALRPDITPAYTTFIANHEIKQGYTMRSTMALTFDCGGHTPSLMNILQILKDHNAKATFFLEGNFVKKVPNIVPLILADGHDLGNHSYSHPYFTSLTHTQVISELQQTEAAMAIAAGQPLPMRYFRFPYGDRNQQIIEWIAEIGYQSIFWDIDPKGWQSSALSSTVVSTVIQAAHQGGIILMHCGAIADEAALPFIIPALQAQGYVLETLSDMLSPDQIARHGE